MICPKCNHRMKVTHSYAAGEAGTTQRMECPNRRCGIVATAVTVAVAIEPMAGQGARSVARKMQQSKTMPAPLLVGISPKV